jgi:hypothetical protein
LVKIILTTRPTHDVPVSYLHSFSKELVEILRSSKDFHITNLEGPDATRHNFEQHIKQEKPGLIFLNGHGTRWTVEGHDDEVILDKENISLSKGSIIYAISCDSLDDLGELSIKKGVRAFVGYRASFMLIKDPSRLATPNKDKNALPFKRVCLILINALVYGRKVSDAVQTTKQEYKELIRSYGSADDDPFGDAPLIRFALTWNHEFLDFCGDPDACFV